MASSPDQDPELHLRADKVDLNMAEILETINLERKKLEEEREAFEKEKLAWLSSKSKLEASHLGDSLLVDVTGSSFTCSLEIRRNIDDPTVSEPISGLWKLEKQNDGSVAVYCEPSDFHHIMTYLNKYAIGLDLSKWHRALSYQEKLHVEEDRLKDASPEGIVLDEETWNLIHPACANRLLLYTTIDKTRTYESVCRRWGSLQKMVVVSKLQNGKIIGAFTSVAWKFNNQWQADSEAFLFCQEPGSMLEKFGIIPGNEKNATRQSGANLLFGAGYDLNFTIIQAPNTQANTSSSFNFLSGALTQPNQFLGANSLGLASLLTAKEEINARGVPSSFPALPIALSPPQPISVLEIWTLT